MVSNLHCDSSVSFVEFVWYLIGFCWLWWHQVDLTFGLLIIITFACNIAKVLTQRKVNSFSTFSFLLSYSSIFISCWCALQDAGLWCHPLYPLLLRLCWVAEALFAEHWVSAKVVERESSRGVYQDVWAMYCISRSLVATQRHGAQCFASYSCIVGDCRVLKVADLPG